MPLLMSLERMAQIRAIYTNENVLVAEAGGGREEEKGMSGAGK